ncbi:MAG TPA: SgcJ/EcaC family oxidoreductase [Sphingomicrobium sp.]|nr:SgcJ/EcaC family oxidoreductase [Sphingomicrobium sp.]
MEASREQHDAAAALAERFSDSWNRRDGPAYGDAYWPDAELVDPTGTIWDGRDAIEQMHVELWNGPASGTRVEARVRRVRALSPTLMVVDLEVAVAGFIPAPPGTAAAEVGMVRANLKHVAEMRAGEWKIVASQNTFVAAPPPQ